MNSKNCATCGRPRGIAQQRDGWRLQLTTIVPRTDNPEDRPAQIINDLVVHAGVYRNGGTNADTHLCDDCLKTGLLAIKASIDEMLGETDEIATDLHHLTARLGRTQLRLHNVVHDHNRMQGRLRDLLENPADLEALRLAEWEVARGHATDECA